MILFLFSARQHLRISLLGSTPTAADALRFEVGQRYWSGASKEGKQILRKTPKRFQPRTRKGNETFTCARKELMGAL
jgi:hypothetical protein